MKNITITPDLEEKLVFMCVDELHYHINEVSAPEEYETEIYAQIELLRLLGREARAESFRIEYENYLDDARAAAA